MILSSPLLSCGERSLLWTKDWLPSPQKKFLCWSVNWCAYIWGSNQVMRMKPSEMELVSQSPLLCVHTRVSRWGSHQEKVSPGVQTGSPITECPVSKSVKNTDLLFKLPDQWTYYKAWEPTISAQVMPALSNHINVLAVCVLSCCL